MKVINLTAMLLPFILTPRTADAQVLRCSERMSLIRDGVLQRSIDKLKSLHPSVTFQTNDQPCQHARDTVSALVRTVGRNHLTHVSGYELVKVLNGEGYFTIERFASGDAGSLRALESALKRRNPHKLAVEANAYYAVFMSGSTIVLMTSSGIGHESNKAMFEQVQQYFESSERPPPFSGCRH
jgi:hypothetical protein